MYSIDSFNVLYNGIIIYNLKEPIRILSDVIIPQLNIKLVLKQKGDSALVHYKDTKSEIHTDRNYPMVYLFFKGELIKTFTANVYYCNPYVDFIRDYFIIYENDCKLNLYDLVRSINYDCEMVRGIHVISDDFFILGYGNLSFSKTSIILIQ